jgi:hypothetical protein
MTQKRSDDIDLRKEGGLTFHRGSALSLFASDRREDIVALALALLIALAVYVFIG